MTTSEASLPLYDGPNYLIVAETRRAYLRRVDDLLKALICLLVLVVIVLAALYARSTSQAVARDLSAAVANSKLAQLLQLPLNLLMNLFVLSAPLAIFGVLIFRRRWRELLLSVLTAVAGGLVSLLFTVVFFNLHYYLGVSEIFKQISRAHIVPVAPHLTAVGALLAFTGERHENKMTRWLWNIFFALSLLAVIQNRVSLPTASITLVLGAGIGFLARFAFGVRNPRPEATSIALAVNKIGLVPRFVIRRDEDEKLSWAPRPRAYAYELDKWGRIVAGSLRPVRLPATAYASLSVHPEPELHLSHTRCFEIRDEQGKHYRAYTAEQDSRILTWLVGMWRNVQLRELGKPVSSSLRAHAEYRALMSSLVAKSGMNMIPYYGLASNDDAFANVYEHNFSTFSSLHLLPAQLRECVEGKLAGRGEPKIAVHAGGDATGHPENDPMGERATSNAHLPETQIAPSDMPLTPAGDLATLPGSTPVSDTSILAAWHELAKAHHLGITHRCISLGRARWRYNPATQNLDFYLVNWENGEVAASEFSRTMDRVQLLTLFALLFGPERAVRTAAQTLGVDELVALLPYVQPLMLVRSMRATAKKTRLLPPLREEIMRLSETQTVAPQETENQDASLAGLAQMEKVELQRFSPQRVAFIALGVFALFAVVGSLNFQQLKEVLSSAKPLWITLGALAALSISVGQTLSLQAVTPRRLPAWPTYLVQTAGALTALVAPAGVGGAILNLRFLARRGFTRAHSLAAVTLMQAVQVVITFLALGVTLAITGTTSLSLSLPSYRQILWAAVVIALLAGLFTLSGVRSWLWRKVGPSLEQLWPRLLWLFSNPLRLAATCAGAGLQLLFQIACFYCALCAFGQSIGLETLIVTFLVSNTLGSIIPTPGGLGPVEAALTAGLQVAGVSTSSALATALLYRLLTFWLRAPIGWVALKYLQARRVL